MARARYHVVYTRVWTSPTVRALTLDGRDAWLYLLTSPHRTTEGLFRLPIPVAAYDLRWDPQRTALAFSELEQAGFIAIDPGADLVWLVNAVEWNTPKGPKQIKGAVNALAEVPSSPLMGPYLARCRQVNADLADAIASQLGWQETLWEPYRNPSDCSFSFSSSNSPPPTPPPNDHPGPPPAADAALVLLADQTIQAAMLDPTVLATAAERQLVADVLAAGHLERALAEAADDATGSSARKPRAYLRAILKRLAANPPATAAGESRPEPKPCPNPNCSGGWVGGLADDDGRPTPVERCPDCTGIRTDA